MILGLHHKIVGSAAAGILIALLCVGGVFSALLERQYEEDARKHLDEAFGQFDRLLQDRRTRLESLADALVRRADFAARLNLVTRYAGQEDQKIFDEEKRLLAEALAQAVAGTSVRRIGLYDPEGRLVAFHAVLQGGMEATGFGYRIGEGAGAFRTRRGDGLPAGMAPVRGGPLPLQLRPLLKGGEGGIVLAVEAPVYRRHPGAEADPVGSLLVEDVLDGGFVQAVSHAAGHGFALSATDGAILSAGDMDRASFAAYRDIAAAEGWKSVPAEGGVMGIGALPLQDGKRAAIGFVASRADVLAPLAAFRTSLFWALALLGGLLLPVGYVLIRRLVLRPVGALMEGVEALKQGEVRGLAGFRSTDELGVLAQAFQDMAAAVRDREARLRKAHDSLELLVEERTRALTAEIEERRQTEMALMDSQEKLRLIFVGAADAIVTIDQKGIIGSANPAAERMFGYRIDEMLGRNVSMLMPEPHRSAHDGYLARYLKTGEGTVVGHRREVRAVRGDGTRFPIELSVSAAASEEGTFFTGIITDITRRKEAEVLVTKLSRAVEQSPAIVLITDTRGAIEYVNPRFTQVTGFTPEEVLGKTPAMLKSGRMDEEIYAAMWRTIASGRTWHGEFHNRRKNGGEYWVSASISPITREDGVISHFVAVEEDITERKTLERELRQAKEEAEYANQAKSDFLSRMSHELRTPMNAILGFAQLLDNLPKEPLSLKQKEYVGHILAGGHHLLELINEVLDLARIESGRLVLAMEVCDVRPLLADCLLLAETLAGRRGIAVEDLTGDDALPALRVDATRFRQILINLLSNAVKYNREGGIVRLRADLRDGKTLRIAVEDTGPGIPEERQGELFQPFSRLGAEQTDVEGSGIGLTITRRLVEQMGGAIGFRSDPGKGATFWIDFPRA